MTMRPLHGDDVRIDCVLCGKCLTVCPLFNTTGREELSPKAKFHLMRVLSEDAGALREKSVAKLAGLCLSCGRCEKACPRGLCAPEMIANVRAGHPGWESFLWEQWVKRAGLLWPMAVAFTRAAPAMLFPGQLGKMVGSLAALDKKSALAPWIKVTGLPKLASGEKIAVFPGCVAAHSHKGWLETAKALLGGMGFNPLVPDFACCGSTLGHAGLKDAQLAMRKRNLEAWRAAGRPKMVTFCATCRCGLKGYADADLGWGPGEAQAWSAAQTGLSGLMTGATYEVMDNAPEVVIYHKPCHGSGDGGDLNLLRAAAGERVRFKEGQSACCGFGGLLQLGAPDLSHKVAERTIDFYDPPRGSQIVTGCSGCTVQFKANVTGGVAAGHWLEIMTL